MEEIESNAKARHGTNWLRTSLISFAALVAITVLIIGTVYTISPSSIRRPALEHYHFRMQIIVDGEPVNFAEDKFQTPYEKGQCSAELSSQPIHFHDQKGQFVHIHWDGITGGLVLKNYGWNFVGGFSGALGYRFDNLPKLKSVPIHGRVLPVIPKGTKFWTYTGDANSYKARSFDDFKSQNLEKFFGKPSNLNHTEQSSLLDWFLPKASAHSGHEHADTTLSEEERLTQINNLIGNVVIFVQKDQPTDAKIKERFSQLEPLSESTCGG